MFICEQMLDKKTIKELLGDLNNWNEGKSYRGKTHKDNSEQTHEKWSNVIREKICEHPQIRYKAFLKQLTIPRFNKYGPTGQKYSDHVDFFRQEGIRTDWSMTLFLTEPDTYEGGELVIQEPLGERQIKLPAGDMIVYPSGQVHRVNPVTKGERIAAIGWGESFVQDYGDRILLGRLVDIVNKAPEALNVELSYIYNNLLKKWST